MTSVPAVAIVLVVFGLLLRYAVLAPAATGTGAGAGGHDVAGRARRTRPRHSVPAHRVDAVCAMFPHLPRAAIEHDLAVTGSVELTCDNILAGTIAIPVQPHPTVAASQAVGTASSSATSTTDQQPRTAPFTAALCSDNTVTPTAEPPRVWAQDPNTRGELLAQRKQFLLRQARNRLIAQRSASSASSASASSTSAAIGTQSTPEATSSSVSVGAAVAAAAAVASSKQ